MPFTLPPPAELEPRARLVGSLDTLLEPELASRLYDFDPAWARGERLFAARDNEGSHAFVWFGRAGAFIRGRHADKKAVPGERLFAGVPRALAKLTREPAFDLDGDSFAAWWDGKKWLSAVDPKKGGLTQLLGVLDGNPASFARHAAAHHEVKLERGALADVYRGAPLTAALRTRLTGGPTGKRWSEGLPKAPEGDAEFKVVRLGDDALLVVAGRVQLRATGADLYVKLIDQVRATLLGTRTEKSDPRSASRRPASKARGGRVP